MSMSPMLLLVLGLVCIPSLLVAGDENQAWLEGVVTAKLNHSLKARLSIQSRLDDRGSLIYEQNDIGLAYTGPKHWLDLGLGYQVSFKQQEDDLWQYRTTPHLDGTARFRLLGLAFSNRVRLEYNSLDALSDFGTFRNKISLNPPVYLDPVRERQLLGHHKVRPFASYELFYSTSGDGVDRHRFTGGVSGAFAERVILDLYYLRQESQVGTDWVGLNVVGLNLKLLF